uniref:Regulatory protein zeste n=2 Tax=Lutzomyia longipalpis TaxID=7200 RepID=A0A1B0CN46_LUTLO
MNLSRIKWTFLRAMSRLAWRGKDDAVKKDNFSHISRKKSLWELMRLSCIMMGIELAYSAETAFVSPILLNIGIHHKYMTMVWSLSACLSIICSPLIGPLTDQCRLALGRRRPLMIFLSVLLLLGLILVPHGAKIGLWLEWVTMPVKIEKSSSLNPWTIFCTVLGTIVLDFSADNCQTPSRAYLLDMCLPADHTRALSTFSIMSGIGSFLGYAMSAYDWESLSWTHHLGGNISTVFAVVAVIFTISALLTLTTFREVPLPVLEDQPTCSPIPSCKDIQRIQSERRKISFGAYIKSILRMPASIKILCTVSLLGWMGDVCYTLYFTDFVGETVFRGDPGSDSQSQEYGLYESGVRFGCWGIVEQRMSDEVKKLKIKDMANIAEKTIIRSTSKQMKHLVDFIEAHVESSGYAESGIRRDSTTMMTDETWEKLGGELNELGPPERPWRGWKKVWRDLSAEARSKVRHGLARKSKAYSNKPLTPLQKKTLKIRQRVNELKHKSGKTIRGGRASKTSYDHSYIETKTEGDCHDTTDTHLNDEFHEDQEDQSKIPLADPSDPLKMEEESVEYSFEPSPRHDSLSEAPQQQQDDWEPPFYQDGGGATKKMCKEALETIKESNRTFQESLYSIKDGIKAAVTELKAIRGIQAERLDIERSKLKLEKEKIQLMKEELAYKNAKFILISASSLFGLSMICLAVWPTKINVLVLSVFAGINFSTIFTVPFILIAQYHAQESFRGFDGMVVDDGKKVDAARGLGTDIAIINSSLFLAQIFVSLIIGALVSLTGSTSAVIYSAGVFRFRRLKNVLVGVFCGYGNPGL